MEYGGTGLKCEGYCLRKRMYGVLKFFGPAMLLCFLLSALLLAASELVNMSVLIVAAFFRLVCFMGLCAWVAAGFVMFGVSWLSCSLWVGGCRVG